MNNSPSLIKRFAAHQNGSIAIISALTLSAVLIVTGAAVDYGRTITVLSKAQSASDAAALAAAATDLSDGERKTMAKEVFAENFSTDGLAASPKVNVKFHQDKSVQVDVELALKTHFLTLIGFSSLPINATSVAAIQDTEAEIALVLDVSGSMRASMGAKTRIEVLKEAAHNLVDIVSEGSNGSEAVKFGVVPFTMNVNIGTENSQYVTGTGHTLFNGTTWAGCVFERKPPHHVTDSYTDNANVANGKWHAYIWPPEPDGANQCLNPSDGTNNGYASVQTNAAGVYNPWTSGPNYNCVRHSIMRLTTKTADVHTKIDDLTSQPNMGTIIAPGVTWGMRLLSPEEPFDEGGAYASNRRKIIIVLTDGAQTTEAEYQSDSCHAQQNTGTEFEFDPNSVNLPGDVLKNTGPDDLLSPYGYILDSDPFNSNPMSLTDVADDLEDVSLAACTEAKKQQAGGREIEIYSIAVSTSAGPGTRVHDLLKNCASNPDNFFYAENSDDLNKAFEDIADDILNVRLTN